MASSAPLFDLPAPRRAKVREAAAELGQGHRERMRQRLMEAGGDAFADHELLEYVLALAIPRRDTKPLAKKLIERFGTYAAVLSAEPAALLAFEDELAGRLSEGAAAALKFVQASSLRLLRAAATRRDVVAGWDDLVAYLHAAQAHGLREQFRVIFLNAKNYLLDDHVFGEGTIDQAPVYTREILKRALDLGATAIVLVHNHPSGDPTPSREDVAITKELIAAGRAMGVAVHDHVVIGASGHASLRALGLI